MPKEVEIWTPRLMLVWTRDLAGEHNEHFAEYKGRIFRVYSCREEASWFLQDGEDLIEINATDLRDALYWATVEIEELYD